MDANKYQLEQSGREWRVRHGERGVVGVVMRCTNRFEASVRADDEKRVTIGYGQSLRSLIEQVIWYDRAMNQEAE